jgi:hypothetical protein
MRFTPGRLLVATAVLHQLIGLLGGVAVTVDGVDRNLFAEIGELGVIDAVGTDYVRIAWFWFLITGFVLLALGDLARRLEARGMVLPASLGWQMLAIGVGGAALMPVSGFWLVIPQGAWIAVRARRRAAALAAAA